MATKEFTTIDLGHATQQRERTPSESDETRFKEPGLKGGSSDAGPIIGLLICVSVVQLVMIIVCYVYAFQDQHDDCQDGKRGGINLFEWCVGEASAALITLVLLWVVVGVSVCVNTDPTGGVFIILTLSAIFSTIWNIWGIVVLSTNENNQCVAEGKPFAIVAIVYIAISLLTSCSASKNKE